MFDQKRYDKACKKYGKDKMDDALENVELYCAAHRKKYKNDVAAAVNFLKRAGVQPLPGWGIPKRPAAPTVCDMKIAGYGEDWDYCCGKVKSTHDEALCMMCGKEWRLLGNLWIEVAEVEDDA